jgi:hypothetical protein
LQKVAALIYAQERDARKRLLLDILADQWMLLASGYFVAGAVLARSGPNASLANCVAIITD